MKNSDYYIDPQRTNIDSFLNLLYDDDLEEIMFIGPSKPVKVFHRSKGMCNTNLKMTKKEADSIVEQIISNLDESAKSGKIINTSLADGSRVNIVRGNIAEDGPIITIRKFKKEQITIIDLIKSKTITQELAAFLWMCIDGLNTKPMNIIFCGGTSTGKTTILAACSVFIPKTSRIITIEDVFELRLIHNHIVNLEATDNIPMADLLKNTLRMRPDRIIVGEVRGSEAQTLFTAMNIGHNGCIGTLHSNTARETISRLTNRPMNVPTIMLENLDLIVMVNKKTSNNKIMRYISEVSEISGSEGQNPLLNTIFSFNESRNILERTNVPARARDKISKAAGITIGQFEEILNKRRKIISALVEQNQKYSATELLSVFDEQSKITKDSVLEKEGSQYTENYSQPHQQEKKQENETIVNKISSFFEDKMF